MNTLNIAATGGDFEYRGLMAANRMVSHETT